MKKGKSFLHLHLGERIWGLIGVFLCGLLLVWGYNYSYNHSSPHVHHDWDKARQTALRLIPDYHPKKQTNGTKKTQNAERAVKDKVYHRGQ